MQNYQNFLIAHVPSGGVKVIIDVGWFRDEVNTVISPYVDLTNGQQHVVNVRRVNQGSTMIIQVKINKHSSQHSLSHGSAGLVKQGLII